MKNIFLTSSLQTVAKDLSKYLNKSIKKFLFITTASELEKGDKWWLRADRKGMADLGYELEDYTLTDKSKKEVSEALKKVDGVIMAGGNTFYLLQQIQLSGSFESLKKFVKDGGIYIGSSAGSMVAGPDIYASREKAELEKADKIAGYKGLGITDLVIQPHWGSKSFKKSYLGEIMKNSYTTKFKQILLSDNQYIIVDDENIQFIDIGKTK